MLIREQEELADFEPIRGQAQPSTKLITWLVYEEEPPSMMHGPKEDREVPRAHMAAHGMPMQPNSCQPNSGGGMTD